MKLGAVLLGAVVCGFTGTAAAEVTVKFEESVNMLAVNEQKPDASRDGLFSATKTLTMPNGENQIVFRYELFFEDGNERQSVNSQVIIATFTATDAELSLALPRFRDAESAQAQIEPLNWSLLDKGGETIAHIEDVLVRPGVQFGRNFPREAAEYNRKGGAAALNVMVAASTPMPTSTTAPATTTNHSQTSVASSSMVSDAAQTSATAVVQVSTTAVASALPAASEETSTTPVAKPSAQANNTAEEMLHFWYEKADAETKARFKAFINQQ